jgi:hypothetical protein
MPWYCESFRVVEDQCQHDGCPSMLRLRDANINLGALMLVLE